MVCLESSDTLTLLRIKKMIPKKLSATPPALRSVIGSFSAKAAMNIVKMGEMALTMEQSIGVMSGIAIKKVICVRKNPRTEAKNIFTKSFFSTCSLGRNREISQKSAPAPMERRQKSAMGEMRCPLVKSLHTIMFIPKMEYAMKQARWPRSLAFIVNNSPPLASPSPLLLSMDKREGLVGGCIFFLLITLSTIPSHKPRWHVLQRVRQVAW